MTREDKPDAAPVSEPVLYAMLALCEAPMHGYAIMQAVHAMSEGRVRLRTATLYTALGRLREAGLIAEAEDADEGGGRRGRVYRLTKSGRALLRSETRRLERLVEVAHAVGAAGGGAG